MLHVPFFSADSGRKLDMGSGDKKDKMMVGILVGVIVIAMAALVWSITSKPEKGRLGEETVGQCVKPDCDYREQMSNRRWGEMVGEVDEETIRGMNPTRVLCPKCKDPRYTFVKSMTCPQCGHMFVAPNLLYGARRALGITSPPPSMPIMCPKCGVDVVQYWRANKGKAQKPGS